MSRGREKKEFSRRKQSRGKTTASWRLARRAVRNPFAQHAARFRLLTIRLACGRMKPKLQKKGGSLYAPFFWIARSSCLYLVDYGQPPDAPAICPVTLLKVQLTPTQFVCVAVMRKVLVPTAAVTVTPVVALNPGGVPVVIAPDL